MRGTVAGLLGLVRKSSGAGSFLCSPVAEALLNHHPRWLQDGVRGQADDRGCSDQ